MVSKAKRRKRSQARRAAAALAGEAIQAERGGGYGREPRKVEWYWKVLAGFLFLLSALAAVGGLVTFFPHRADASQYLSAARCPAGPVQAQADCVQWIAGEVTGNQKLKNQDTLSLRSLPGLDFTNPAGQITGLRTGEQVQLSMWHGQLQAVFVDGRPYYADGSLVQRPMHDLVLAMFGACGLCLAALLKVVPLLRRRGAGKRLISAARWVFGGLSAGLSIEAVTTILINTLWGGPLLIAGALVLVAALTLVLLGVVWVLGRSPRSFAK